MLVKFPLSRLRAGLFVYFFTFLVVFTIKFSDSNCKAYLHSQTVFLINLLHWIAEFKVRGVSFSYSSGQKMLCEFVTSVYPILKSNIAHFFAVLSWNTKFGTFVLANNFFNINWFLLQPRLVWNKYIGRLGVPPKVPKHSSYRQGKCKPMLYYHKKTSSSSFVGYGESLESIFHWCAERK